MTRELPPITEPVTHEECINLFLRELYSVKDIMPVETMRKILAPTGITPEMVHAVFDNI